MSDQRRLINRLSEDVVNKIAAGEVIQRPANAIKEMLENSLDAKSTNISIILKDGGLKFLQIQDNGTGIKKGDMDIVCERFTTSKLTKFEDLGDISTYGFRGEALASISHVAHVAIVSKTSDSVCAYKGCYCDGNLKDALKPCAGNVGTQITVEDLFYNVPLRRLALKNPTEEHQKVVDVVTRYAVHNAKVGFLVKKQNDTGADVRTPVNSSPTDNIRLLFGPSIARELLELEHKDDRLSFHVTGLVTNANYSTKKRFFILFINDRLVDSSEFRKVVENVYTAYLPKNTHPFVYISLHIAPHNIDVNVHPTKSEVHFLHEVEIYDIIQRKLDVCLLGSNSSRTYFTQTMLPSKAVGNSQSEDSPQSQTSNPLNASFTVRSDAKARKLDAYFVPNLGSSSSQAAQNDQSCLTNLDITFENENVASSTTSTEHPMAASSASTPTISSTLTPPSPSPAAVPTKKRKIKLSSILQLQKEIESNANAALKDILQNSAYVGCIDADFVLLQHLTKLYLVNAGKLSKELFYQIMIYEFGNCGVMKLSEPVPIYELAMLALDDPESGWMPGDGPKEELSNFVVDLLKSKSEMLWDYFSLQISQDGDLCTLPLLLDNYVPHLDDLPKFVIRLATEVDWEKEKNCFKTLAGELSQFYVLKKEFCRSECSEQAPSKDMKFPGKELNLSEDEDGDDEKMDVSIDGEGQTVARILQNSTETSTDARETENRENNWKWMMEHAIYPALKTIFVPSKKHASDGSLLQLANLPDLYKVFERC